MFEVCELINSLNFHKWIWIKLNYTWKEKTGMYSKNNILLNFVYKNIFHELIFC